MDITRFAPELFIYRIDARVYSNTLDDDYNSSPSDTKSASNAWSASYSTVTDSETDNDAVLAGDRQSMNWLSSRSQH